MTLARPDTNMLGKFSGKHPETSRAAAVDLFPRSGNQRVQVLASIHAAGERGRTDYELERRGFTRSSASTRRFELQQLGWVKDSGKRRPTGTGQMAIVWVLSDEAQAVLLERPFTTDDLKLPDHLKAKKGTIKPRRAVELLQRVLELDSEDKAVRSLQKEIRREMSGS
jgi:hypothetical protein